MARLRGLKRVVVKGTVCPADHEEGWNASSVIVVTDNDIEYAIIPDEIGVELADHLYDVVRVHGVLEGEQADRDALRAWRFDVLSYGSGDDFGRDIELDGEGYALDYLIIDVDDNEWINS